MSCKLLDMKNMPVSEIANLRTTISCPALSFSHTVGVKISSKSCSFRGTSTKAYYSIIHNKANGSMGRERFAAESFYRINGNIGTSSSLLFHDVKVLRYFDDEYDGVIVDPEKLPLNPSTFASMLHSSLSHWKIKGKKGVWLKLPRERSELVPIAVKEGFEYHHAEKAYVMLTYWIPDEPCFLPSNASHQVGVGGFVLNNNKEVLVVQEKYCASASVGLWKLPTGFIHESEEIFSGAVREVKEETGIESEFVEVIAFRHAQNVAFEKSDLFFICMLKPLSTQIIVDDIEIQAAKWMPLDEFIEQPLIQADNMFKRIMEICLLRLGKRYCGLSPHHVVSRFDGKSSSLYYNIIENGENCLGN